MGRLRESARRGFLRGAGMSAGVLVIAACSMAVATSNVAAQSKPRTVHYTATALCAQISQSGTTHVLVCAGSSPVFGGSVAAVAPTTFSGLHATDNASLYTANGVRRSKETFTAEAGANGAITFTGSGVCTGGTGVFKNAKCNYALTGSQNPGSNVTSSTEVGTITFSR